MTRDRSGGEGENEKSGLVFVASVAQRTERGVLYLPPVWCMETAANHTSLVIDVATQLVLTTPLSHI